MFKRKIKERFKGCYTREDFLKIRRELKNFGEDNFKKEYNLISSKYNPFIKLILGKTRDNCIDYDDFILTPDRDHKDHYLLLPKDTSYFNILTLTKKDIPMLKNMKEIIINNLGDKVLFFHCYPFNSIHTIHLHIFEKDTYIHKTNDLNIDDVIFVIENEDILNLNILNNEDKYKNIIKDWFKTKDISLLNIYVISLILIEETKEENKKELIPYALNYILGYLDIEKDKILDYYKEEKDTLESIGKILFHVSKNSNLLQKR
jgi:hypothetical protein